MRSWRKDRRHPGPREGRRRIPEVGTSMESLDPRVLGVLLCETRSYWRDGVHVGPRRGLCWLFSAPLSPHSPSLAPGPQTMVLGPFPVKGRH